MIELLVGLAGFVVVLGLGYSVVRGAPGSQHVTATNDVDRSQSPASNTLEEPTARKTSIVVAGYVLAVIMPIVGFIVGVILVNRSEKSDIRLGLWMIGLSVAAAFVFFVILIVSVHSTAGGLEGG